MRLEGWATYLVVPTSARRLLRATRRALRALLKVKSSGSIFSEFALEIRRSLMRRLVRLQTTLETAGMPRDNDPISMFCRPGSRHPLGKTC